MKNILIELFKKIENRVDIDPKESYTASLLKSGNDHCARKFDEESIELIISCSKENKENIKKETADVLYHLLVLLVSKKVDFEEVLDVLEMRSGVSGHEEKKLRQNNN